HRAVGHPGLPGITAELGRRDRALRPLHAKQREPVAVAAGSGDAGKQRLDQRAGDDRSDDAAEARMGRHGAPPAVARPTEPRTVATATGKRTTHYQALTSGLLAPD